MFLLVKCNFVTNKTSAYRRGNGKRGRLLHGYGYNVTWAFGYLVQPALPEGYGIRGFHPENLPIIPQVFTLVPRQVKTDKGYKPDTDRFCHKSIVNLWQNEGPQDTEKGPQEYKQLKTKGFE